MKTKVAALFLLGLPLWAQSYKTYTISTFAAGGLPTLPAPALSLSIGFVDGVAVDAAGNSYVADSALGLVYKVSAAGVATIYAGTGEPGYSGDGGPATSAQLFYPASLAIDSSGNLFIADTGNSVIRKVSPSGTITAFAGNGTYGYSGDGGPATAASLEEPYGVAVDASGNVYIADTFNSVIRLVSTAGIITTFAGNNTEGYTGDGGAATAASLSYPEGVAADASGNVYIADDDNSVVRKVSGGIITTFAGNGNYGYSGDGGPAAVAELAYPEGVAADAGGNVYISDTNNSVIRKVSTTGIITTIAGDGTSGYAGDGTLATGAQLSYPAAIFAGPGGILLIADFDNDRVREVSSAGIITTIAGNGFDNYGGDNGPATAALMGAPGTTAVGSDGSVYIADSGNNRIRKVSTNGVITTIAGTGIPGFAGDGGAAFSAQLDNPSGVAVDSSGNVYVADTYNNVIRKISSLGVITTIAGLGYSDYSGDGGPATNATFYFPGGVALDSAGNIYVADTYNNAIREIFTNGIINTVAGNNTASYYGDGGPATAAALDTPYGLALDAIGNIYIADTYNSVIREVNTSGVITTISATSGPVYGPYGVAVDGGGNIYIADTYNSTIDAVSSTGIFSIIAGAGFGYAGDGGPAINAELSDPEGLSVGSNGVIYVADTYNNAIRALNPCIQTLASSASADSTAQTLNIPITAASSCSYSATSLPSWVTSASTGTGTGAIMLALQANTTGLDRSATITVNELPVTVSQAFTQQQFADVLPSGYYFDAVNLLKSKSVTSGCGTNDYCPGAAVTRDDMAIFIVRTILGLGSFTYSPTPHFADVSTSYFAFPWIQKLYELGITAGCSTVPMLLYCPGETVTRDQMAIFIIRARYGPTTAFTWNSTPYFSDVPGTYYAFDWIQRMYQDSITAGCTLNPLNYCPGNAVSRGDMAIFLMRGGYNDLLPATEPVIASILPATLAPGATATFTITGANTTFQQGVTNLVFPASTGITVNSISVTSPTTMQVSLTASPTAPQQPVSVYEQTGPQEAVLPNGLLIN